MIKIAYQDIVSNKTNYNNFFIFLKNSWEVFSNVIFLVTSCC